MRQLLDWWRLWPTGDVAWCHSADAVTADTPHSDTELLVLVPRDLLVSVATTGVPVCHLPSVQHDSGLFCLWTREKAGLRPTQSPNSHWMICSPPSSPQYLSTIWHLMRSTDENGSTCAKCEGEHRSPCRGVKNNNNLVFTFLIFFHFIFNIKQIFTNQNLINFS